MGSADYTALDEPKLFEFPVGPDGLPLSDVRLWQDDLPRLNTLYVSHLNAFPLAAEAAQRLVVEIRPADIVNGWKVIQALEHLSNHIRTLDLHVASFECVPETLTDLLDNKGERLHGGPIIPPYKWRQLPQLDPGLHLPLVTTLAIVSWQDCTHYLSLLLDHLPNLRHLALTSGEDVGSRVFDWWPFQTLESLTMVGPARNLGFLLSEMRSCMPNLQNLTIKLAGADLHVPVYRYMLATISKLGKLVRLAIYGSTDSFVHWSYMEDVYRDAEVNGRVGSKAFDRIEELVLEEKGAASGSDSKFPILDDVSFKSLPNEHR